MNYLSICNKYNNNSFRIHINEYGLVHSTTPANGFSWVFRLCDFKQVMCG